MADPYLITTREQLRELVPEAAARTHSKVTQRLGEIERSFIAGSPMVMLSTVGKDGPVTVSPKGDAPGFVHIQDDRTLVIPDRPGNGLAYGLQNLLDDPRIGLLFVRPGSAETFRVDGRAELTRDPALLLQLAARNKHAIVAIRVHIERCFFHCSKAFVRSSFWKPEQWPEPFKFSWGAWAKQWYDVPAEAASQIDAEIEQDERDNL